MSDGCAAIAEAHQSAISKPTHLIVPNTPEAERLVGMMNKNLLAFLYYTLVNHGLPELLVEDLLEHSCEATMLATKHCCKWDKVNRILTTDDLVQAEKAMAFKEAAWFKDEFGLLGKNAIRKQTRYTVPEALFNLNDARSRKTIHDPHKKPQVKEGPNAPVGTLPRKGTQTNLAT